MTVYSHEYMKEIIRKAYDEHYALPAINVSNLDTAIAAFNGLKKANSPGFIQVTLGSVEQASPNNDPVEGSIILGRMLTALREDYDIPVFIHTDHCHYKYVDTWLVPLMKKLIEIKNETGERIFDSFMFDGSMTDIYENARVIRRILPLVRELDAYIEVEAGGAWGGKEDGIGGGAKYSTPDDVKIIQNAMHSHDYNDDDYLLAVAFGNAHGTAVVPNLKPELLHEISVNTNEHNFYVFHGGSGSPADDVREAVRNGVVKMNVDTDTQYAFTHGVFEFWKNAPLDPDVSNFYTDDDYTRKIVRAAERHDYDAIRKTVIENTPRTVVTSHKHGKDYFDPRHWNKAGRDSMSEKIIEITYLLGSHNKA